MEASLKDQAKQIINSLTEDKVKVAISFMEFLKTLDGREFVLAEVDDFNREIELTRQNQELMKFLDERSKERKTLTLNQVRKQLKLKRKVMSNVET